MVVSSKLNRVGYFSIGLTNNHKKCNIIYEMRRVLFALWIFLLALPIIARGAAPNSKPAIGWRLISPIESPEAKKAIEAFDESLSNLPVAMVRSDQLKSSLRELDRRAGVLEEAGKLLQSARDAHLGLKLDVAIDLYRKSTARLAEGFVELYNPGLLAEPTLQLGVALQQAGKSDEARKTFQQALVLVPYLTLDEGYYSPTVRKSFERVRAEHTVNAPAFPAPERLGRICAAAGLDGLLVISMERLSNRPMLSVRLFSAGKSAFTAMETMVLDEQDPAKAGRELGERLRLAVAQVAGVSPIASLVEKPTDTNGLTVVPTTTNAQPVSPWYRRHWWIWPVAAGVIVTAIVLPLTVFRKDVMDVRIRY
jgi:tetratricopeptide (TPR) repeat protein